MTSVVAPQAQRFYPAEITPFGYEPLRSDFAIEPAGAKRGEGLKALRDFAPGTVVFAFTGHVVREMTLYSLQLGADTHIHDPYVMGKVLHHCAPNCRVDVIQRTFVAIRPIAAGDYVTMDYCQTEDVLFQPFNCKCGAAECRGRISGRYLASRAVLDEFVAEAERRLARLTRSTSRYDNLVNISAVCQELGNALSSRLYAASLEGKGKELACKSGCATCCHIPYTVPQVKTTDYTMTVLDVIALVEHLDTLEPLAAARSIATSAVLPVVPCPQLNASGACGIYANRPVTCKIWFSSSLDLCLRNRERGYKIGVNALTDESDRLRSEFEAPFGRYLQEWVSGLAFRGHDFLSVFEMTTTLARTNTARAFRANIDAGLDVAAAFSQAVQA